MKRGWQWAAAGMVVALASAGAAALGEQPPSPGAPVDPAAQAPTSAPAAPAQTWKGAVSLPGGAALEFSVVLTPGKDGAPGSGTMSIPMQGLKDGALSDVEVTERAIRFTLGLPSMPKEAWAYFSATIEEGGTTAKGTLEQAGMTLPLTMRRLAEGESVRPRRPQEPVGPLPYAQREVTFTNPADGAKLAGTLTIPAGRGPFPAVFLITGSGPEDRDETVFEHKPFLVLADHLTRSGIVVLRADDRGVGGSTSPKGGAETTDDVAADALAAAEFLAAQPEVDPKRIGLIGHSEGGLAAPMAAAQSERIAFIVLLAGPGVPGREILPAQLSAILRAAGVDEASIAAQREHQVRALDLVAAGAPAEQVRAALRELVEAQMRVAGGGAEPDAAVVERLVEGEGRRLAVPWMRRFLTLDPREALRRTRCPVLALNGSLDTQVVASQNLPEIRRALEEGGNRDVTVREMPGLNHLFQTAVTGGVQEYAQIEETFAPAALEEISGWILARFGPGRGEGEAQP
jgi:pimeloyl-ACP methyl ester carboxylesterase